MRNLKIYVFAALTFAGVSCKKYLDQAPIDTTPESLVFSSIVGVENAIAGSYAAAAAAQASMIYATSLMTDEAFFPTENNTGRGVIPFRWQHTSGSTEYTDMWGQHYNTINRVNKILGNIDAVPTTDANQAALKAQFKGEALALRAWSHFELAKAYSVSFNAGDLAVPYMLESIISKPSRKTWGEVITQAKADLAEAKTLIPTTFTRNTRITRLGVSAIQADVALYEKNWDNALASAAEVISAGGTYALANQTQYPNIWRDQSQQEVIFKFKRNAGETRIGDVYFDRTQSKIVYGPSKELRDVIDQTNDIRYGTIVLTLSATRLALNKYRGGDAANVNLADLKVYRTSEMYLIRAEAYAEKNDLINGAIALNAVRRARITGYIDQVFVTKDALINAILQERFKELAFEGKRYLDLKRKGLPITRIPEDIINAPLTSNLQTNDPLYIWPLPLREQQANENIVQNRGY